jgi:hypothetical protein
VIEPRPCSAWHGLKGARCWSASHVREQFLKDHLELVDFTFLDVPTWDLFTVPDGPVQHLHTDCWMHTESVYRQQARAWLHQLIQQSN